METILVYGAKPENIRELIKEAGNKIGAVHFFKRKDGELRKMAYRLHVKNPSTAKKPIGVDVGGVDTSGTDHDLTSLPLTPVAVGNKRGSVVVQPNYGTISKKSLYKSDVDYANDQITVLDVNKVIRGEDGKVIGRGAWRTIPLENVVEITCNGKRYIIKK